MLKLKVGCRSEEKQAIQSVNYLRGQLLEILGRCQRIGYGVGVPALKVGDVVIGKIPQLLDGTGQGEEMWE